MSSESRGNPAGELTGDLDMDTPESRREWAAACGDVTPVRGTLRRVGIIPHGMASGAPSVAILVELDNGVKVFAETSWRPFGLIAAALISRWGTI